MFKKIIFCLVFSLLFLAPAQAYSSFSDWNSFGWENSEIVGLENEARGFAKINNEHKKLQKQYNVAYKKSALFSDLKSKWDEAFWAIKYGSYDYILQLNEINCLLHDQLSTSKVKDRLFAYLESVDSMVHNEDFTELIANIPEVPSDVYALSSIKGNFTKVSREITSPLRNVRSVNKWLEAHLLVDRAEQYLAQNPVAIANYLNGDEEYTPVAEKVALLQEVLAPAQKIVYENYFKRVNTIESDAEKIETMEKEILRYIKSIDREMKVLIKKFNNSGGNFILNDVVAEETNPILSDEMEEKLAFVKKMKFKLSAKHQQDYKNLLIRYRKMEYFFAKFSDNLNSDEHGKYERTYLRLKDNVEIRINYFYSLLSGERSNEQ